MDLHAVRGARHACRAPFTTHPPHSRSHVRISPARKIVFAVLLAISLFGSVVTWQSSTASRHHAAHTSIAATPTGLLDTQNKVMLASASHTTDTLTPVKAAILGVVEGVTEFLPISSTGHLEITNSLLGIGQTDATRDAANAYTIAIQAGAIVAVLFLYFGRVRGVLFGIVGKDADGRRLFFRLIVAFLPAAFIGLIAEKAIKTHLFGTWPIVFAWIAGGVAILFWSRSRFAHGRGIALEGLTIRMAMLIGLAQCVAMWPGTSRSLVTIIAAVCLGLTMTAAVEFSFLLGLLTLGAATAYEALTKGGLMLETFGWTSVLIGFFTAFLFAVISVKWMVTYLQRHSFAVFGWYRIVIGMVAIALAAFQVI